jgi:hypothetical protein
MFSAMNASHGSFHAFFGLLLGYAFGGDKWGARLFGFFTGHRVRLDESSRTNGGRWFLFFLMFVLLMVVIG